MNYKESKLILEKIKKAKRILVNCHRGPDPDCIGSALALRGVLINMSKAVDVICPSEKLYDNADFLDGYGEINKSVNFSKFDYKKYDLFIVLDSSSWDMVSSDFNIPVPDMEIAVIDHHFTNKYFGIINLVDKSASSVGEILYRVFSDWKVSIDKNISTSLLTAIIGDTGIFKYPNSTVETFNSAYELMKAGADKNMIVAKLYKNYDFNLIKFWGEVLNNLVLEKENKFIYSAVPFSVFEKYGKPDIGKDTAVDLFAQVTKDTEFGFMALETDKGIVSVSVRSRNDFDSSKIALELGGGGHKAASGARIEGLSFENALQKILEVARKYAKKQN